MGGLVGCDDGGGTDESLAPPVVQMPPPKPIEPKIAEVGVGLKGQSLKDEQGVNKAIVQPAVVLFQTKEKIAFEILIPEALKIFKAIEGRAPSSHEEFMKKIIEENRIKLPVLPPKQVYRFHPDDEQLWVEPEPEGDAPAQ